MFRHTALSVTIIASLLLGGCSFVGDAVWPSLTGVPPEDEETAALPAPTEPGTDTSAANDIVLRQDIETAFGAIETSIAPLQARLGLHDQRLVDLNNALRAQSLPLQDGNPVGTEDPLETWGKLQIDLSRLNDELVRLKILRAEVAADAAAAAQQVATLQSVMRSPALDDALQTRGEGLSSALNSLLASIGRQDQKIGQALTQWDAFTTGQAARIDALRPEPPEPEPGPGPGPRPATTKTVSEGTLASSGPLESGDRFIGRQALATLNFSDPALAFEGQLGDLIGRVQAQYPDVAFDVETVGADQASLDRVLGLLGALNVPVAVFIGAAEEGADPEIRLYPR